MKHLESIGWLKRFAVNRFWNATHAAGGIPTWLGEPAVRRCLNRRISGSSDVWPIDWLARDIARRPYPRALSLGCGEGALERDLLSKGLCGTLLGLDISEQALESARRQAQAAGHSSLSYARADLDRLELEPESYDAVFVHQALHHVRQLEDCLAQVSRALVPGGLFYADEYVGPSRHEWRRELLEAAEEVFQQLPKAARRRRRLQLPVDWRDPSEAVRSSEIVPLIAATFEVRERRDYGGNLFAVIYPHLALERLEPVVREEVLARLIAGEDELLAAGAPSYYTILIAGKKRGGDSTQR